MARVITFSTKYPAHHARAGQPTMFAEKILNGEKKHTIRAGRRWLAGMLFSPRVWSGKPYRSPQTAIAPDKVVTHVWDIDIYPTHEVYINGAFFCSYGSMEFERLAKNDGLMPRDFVSWFNNSLPFSGQIICWVDNVKY